jgi:hypothetical protein
VEKELLLGYERNKGRDWLRNMGASNPLRPQANATLEKAIVYDTDPIRNWPETLFSEGLAPVTKIALFLLSHRDCQRYRRNESFLGWSGVLTP